MSLTQVKEHSKDEFNEANTCQGFPSEAELVEQYRGPLINMLKSMTRDHQRAEDLAHEALIIVLENLRSGKIQQPGQLKSYIFSTARFHFLGWTRRYGNQVHLVESCDVWASDESGAEGERCEEQRRDWLLYSIDSLKLERDREILKRHYIYEQVKPEVCDALALTADQFDRIISRARIRLRESLVDTATLLEIHEPETDSLYSSLGS